MSNRPSRERSSWSAVLRDVANGRDERGGERRGQRDQAGEGKEEIDADGISDDAAEEDDRQPTEVRERDPRSEDAGGEFLRCPLLKDRHSRHEEEHVREAEDREERGS